MKDEERLSYLHIYLSIYLLSGKDLVFPSNEHVNL